MTISLSPTSNPVGVRTHVRMMFEIFATGTVIPSYDAQPRVVREDSIQETRLYVWIAAGFTIFFMLSEAYEMNSDGIKYWQNMWNVLDWVNFILFWFVWYYCTLLVEEIGTPVCAPMCEQVPCHYPADHYPADHFDCRKRHARDRASHPLPAPNPCHFSLHRRRPRQPSRARRPCRCAPRRRAPDQIGYVDEYRVVKTARSAKLYLSMCALPHARRCAPKHGQPRARTHGQNGWGGRASLCRPR